MTAKFAALVLLLSLLSFSQSWAAEDCKDPQTQTDMNICADLAYKEADEELNVTYKKALKILEATNPTEIENFKEVQRAWIKFRDLHCKHAISGYEGGTIVPLIHASCMTELTEQRTKQIPGLFEEWE